jgi:hypothetical protein
LQGLPAQAPETPVLISEIFSFFTSVLSTSLKLWPKASCWAIPYIADMAASWKEAKECAEREGLPQVYHDCDDQVFGACGHGEQQGSFKGGAFVEHRCICMPAHLSTEDLEAKEKNFHLENPDW